MVRWARCGHWYELTESGSSGAAWVTSSSELAGGSWSLDSAVAILQRAAVSNDGGVFRLLPMAAMLHGGIYGARDDCS
jgi:hypothetical protein